MWTLPYLLCSSRIRPEPNQALWVMQCVGRLSGTLAKNAPPNSSIFGLFSKIQHFEILFFFLFFLWCRHPGPAFSKRSPRSTFWAHPGKITLAKNASVLTSSDTLESWCTNPITCGCWDSHTDAHRIRDASPNGVAGPESCDKTQAGLRSMDTGDTPCSPECSRSVRCHSTLFENHQVALLPPKIPQTFPVR